MTTTPPPTATTTTYDGATRWGRRGLVLVIVGLALQLVATFAWSPAMFILSAAVGLPLVLLGGAICGWSLFGRRSS